MHSEYIDPDSASRRQRITHMVESRQFQSAIVFLIALNAVGLGMETSDSLMAAIGGWLLAFDGFVLVVFVAEIAVKLFAYRWRFFRDPWNLFDMAIITIALIPASGPFAVLRALRILRVFRLISMLPRLRLVVESLLSAIPGISAIAGLLFIILYIFAVMATELFGDHHAAWFGSIGASLYTLFQIMTLESWSMGIVRPVMETHPHAWLFFVLFILIATFTVLNLFIAIIVDAMQAMARENRDIAEPGETDVAVRSENLAELHREIIEIRRMLQQQRL
ncbi:MAG TPA: ion transporter [Gammaproteobacteria bacterium]|nr:ion transporter [Gammaproteobacteria bacterium]